MSNEFQMGPNQRKWIQALRSGNYSQGQSFLHKIHDNGTQSFCCLGIACDVFKDQLNLHVENKNGIVCYNDSAGNMPIKLFNFLQMKFNIHSFLTSMNDHQEFSFEQIADEIEKNPYFFFKNSV